MMTDIQEWWVSEHKYVCRIARDSKNPMDSLFEMYKRYDALTISEKGRINELLIQWIENADVGSINSDELYTALACITEYKIVAAIPAMERLCVRLKDCKIPDDPQAYHEREKVLRKLEGLRRQC